MMSGNPAEQVVKQYLEKKNKNYLRGYRKRKIKEEFGFSQGATPVTRPFVRDKSTGR